MLAITAFCVGIGGYAFALLVALAGLLLAREWVAMCGFAATGRPMFWMPIVIVAAGMSAGLDAAGGGLVVILIGTAAAVLVSWRSDGPADIRHGPARPGCLSAGSAVAAGGPVRPGDDRGAGAGQDGGTDAEDGGTGAGHAGGADAGHARGARAGHDGSAAACHDSATGTAHAISRPAASMRDLAFGFPYLGLAAVALPWLRADPGAGLANTLFVLSIVWASDIGAYLVGRLVGGAKLAPAISPGKTWSGAAGGLISAALAGLAVAACFSTGFSPLHVVELALGFGIISQAGDLLESALKRHFGVKDSGRIIPGHGGLLDRVDALLAVAPVAALLAFTVGRGVVLWR